MAVLPLTPFSSSAERRGALVVGVAHRDVCVMGASPRAQTELMRSQVRRRATLAFQRIRLDDLRPEAYAETLTEVIEQTAGSRKRPLVSARGQPISMGHVVDVAVDGTRGGRRHIGDGP